MRVLSQSSIFGQNPKIECQEFNNLQTPKLSKKQLCDRIENRAQNLTLRTWIKQLGRKTICFSKAIEMHDIVIGL
jgi:IS1 family transposase